jgi:hypothetical protein
MDVERVGFTSPKAQLIGQPLPPHQIDKRASRTNANSELPTLLHQFYGTLEELQATFPRRFVPEGCLDQSLGDVLAAVMYDLELVASHAKVSEAKTSDGQRVQLKVTRSKKGTVGLYDRPEALLVLQHSGESLIELYNGPAALVWAKAGKTRKSGVRRIPVSRLKCLGLAVPLDQRLPQPSKESTF